jgi:mRNA-degrading endonuclease RelE of RelBE toxin-antitoxin system
MDSIDKLLVRIPKKHRLQLLEALEFLSDPSEREILKPEKLTGSKKLFRVRVGNYRIIFHTDERNCAIVDDIRLRNESTYRNL